MLGRELRIAIDHHPRFPAAQVLELIAARPGLAMPRRPRVSKVVEPGIRNSGFTYCVVPRAVGQLPRDGLAAVREAVHWMLADFSFQHCHCIYVQRDALRRA